MNSSDKVKKIVLTEGRTARNLVLYNVPLQPDTSSTGGLQTGNLSYSQPRSFLKWSKLKLKLCC